MGLRVNREILPQAESFSLAGEPTGTLSMLFIHPVVGTQELHYNLTVLTGMHQVEDIWSRSSTSSNDLITETCVRTPSTMFALQRETQKAQRVAVKLKCIEDCGFCPVHNCRGKHL